jgi:GntR family transcriptional repressor for pyruvate dehydrogenase complex
MMSQRGVSNGPVLPRPNLSRQLTEQIVSLIASRNLSEGDRLPTMRELARIFSVATPTIREALRRLQATGVIDIRHGSGIYVQRVDQSLMITNPHRSALDREAILNLLDARLVIEPRTAALAAERATEETIQRLETILHAAETLLSGHDDELGPRNMEFHGEIARAAGNPIISQVLDSLIDVYAREQLVIMALYDARAQDHREHLEIFEAIRNRDPNLASDLMTRHLDGVVRVIESRMS